MGIGIKTGSVILAAVAAATLSVGAGVANAAATGSATGSQAASHDGHRVGYGRGFHMTNLSGQSMQLLSFSTDGTMDSRPPDGSVLQPGVGNHDYEMTFWFDQNHYSSATYAVWINGRMEFVSYDLHVDPVGDTSSSCETSTPDLQCSKSGVDAIVTDKAGTVHTVPAGQSQLQAQTLRALCESDSAAGCTFTATGESSVPGPWHTVATMDNPGPGDDELVSGTSDTTGSSDSIEISTSQDVDIAHLVDLELKAKYTHDWTSEKEVHIEDKETVPAGYHGEIRTSDTMFRDTGDFSITLGNTTWNLTGVYFDTLDPNGAVNYDDVKQKLNSTEPARHDYWTQPATR